MLTLYIIFNIFIITGKNKSSPTYFLKQSDFIISRLLRINNFLWTRLIWQENNRRYCKSGRTWPVKVQSCKLYNKYIITSTQITNTEIFTFVTIFMILMFIIRKGNRNCYKRLLFKKITNLVDILLQPFETRE